ncbi:MAG TPA: hypothetical protein VHU15_14205 [Stellaceae bacterium]|nr:hypothetical protein [Stellaceae bacterium]
MQPTPIYKVVRDEKRQRAAWYRQQAAQFESSARAERVSADRDRLLEMAEQYEGLARRLEDDLVGSSD